MGKNANSFQDLIAVEYVAVNSCMSDPIMSLWGISLIPGSALIVWKIKLKAAFDAYKVRVFEWQLAGAGAKE